MIKKTLSILLLMSLIISSDNLVEEISVDWIHSEATKQISAVHKFEWLDNNTAILFDLSLPKSERNFLKLDPKNPEKLTPLVNKKKVLKNFNKILKKDQKIQYLNWPISFDKNGRKAVYIIEEDIFILELKNSKVKRITSSNSVEKSPRFSPDGSKLAFIRDNDLFIYDFKNKREKQITHDGSETILNGTLSWVYWEEIFGRQDIGFWWSNDSKAISFIQTDESLVSKMYFLNHRPVESELITQRYPKAGTDNPKVRLGIFEISNPRIKWAELEEYEYICRVKWHIDNKRISVQTMDRSQTELILSYVDRKTGKNYESIIEERDDGWVNINDDLYFLDSNNFLWQSERDGYAHIYRFNDEGELINQVTKGNWALRSSGGPFWLRRSVVHVDQSNQQIYFTALKRSSIERHLYKINFNGDGLKRISEKKGVHKVSFSPNGKYYFDKYSNISEMPSLTLYDKNGNRIRKLNEPRMDIVKNKNIRIPELFTIPTSDGFQMPAQILKPINFDPNKRYPIIFHIYGGPSAPTVFNQWQGSSLYYDNILLNKGFLILRFDHRSASAISKTLENRLTMMMSGPRELLDISDGIEWLKSQTYIDSTRLGIWGWSGGGSFTLNAMTNTKYFKAGISGAPVTDWHYYDTKWAEFAMKKPEDNLEGYEQTSFVKRAKNLHGRLLLIHGTYDDNVHPQNSWNFIDELINENIMFDMMFYPMRKHGFSDTPAKIHRQNTMIKFWEENL